MVIVGSARKHGISDKDIEYVYSASDVSFLPNGQPGIVMLLGFDTIGRGLEVAYITSDQGEDIVIHAMKIRQSYRRILDGYKGVYGNERE